MTIVTHKAGKGNMDNQYAIRLTIFKIKPSVSEGF
jgi:hypothetical protein